MASVTKKTESSKLAVSGTTTSEPANHSAKRNQRGHSKQLRITIDLNQPGRLRIGHLLTLLAVSHSKFYELRRRGAIPPPDGKDGARPYWRTCTIKALLDT